MPGAGVLEADLNDIAVFAKVVEGKSFTAASRALGLPRSTVSRRVAKLERRLGVRLLHRTTRRLRLTAVGAAYYERCSRSLSAIYEAEAMVQAARAEPRGELRITAPNDLGVFLAAVVGAFASRYPAVSFDVELTQRVVDLVAEGFDLALRATAALPDSTLVARRIASAPVQLYASPSYLEAHGTPAQASELSEHECIVLGPVRSHSTWRLAGAHGSVEIPVRGRIHTNDPSFARDAAIAGAGIAYLPAVIASDALQAGTLSRVLPELQSLESRLYVVYPSAKYLSATVGAFRDFVLARFASFPLVADAGEPPS